MRRKRWARKWHRWLGAVFALPLLWLAVTGLLLNHAERLGLNQRTISSPDLLERYGMIPAGEPRVVQAGRFSIEEWDDLLFLDGKLVEDSGTLVGAVAKPAELVVATKRAVFVYDAQGRLIDRLDEASLPAVPVEAVGLFEEKVLIVKAGGGSWRINEDFLGHEELSAESVVAWSEVAAVGGDARSRLEAVLAEQAAIPWSRVVLDVHSGNLFGTVGRLLVDLSGVAVIVLTLLGIRLLFRRNAMRS